MFFEKNGSFAAACFAFLSIKHIPLRCEPILSLKTSDYSRRRVFTLKWVLSACFFALFFLFVSLSCLSLTSEVQAGGGLRGRAVLVRSVIDGDTIVTGRGEHLRYIGIDTPEKGEFFYNEARLKNKSLLEAGAVRVVECGKEKKDKYGRTLVWVYSGGLLVNGELLSGGYARVLFVPPCGLEKRALMERLSWHARSLGMGIWKAEGGVERARQISPKEAKRHIGEMVRVEGVVRAVRETKGGVFMDFGPLGQRGFTAVIFSGHFKVFEDKGVKFTSFKGKKLSVTGIMRQYRGRAEIIVLSPGQLRP